GTGAVCVGVVGGGGGGAGGCGDCGCGGGGGCWTCGGGAGTVTLKVRRADRFPTETATVAATREPAAVAGTTQLQTATPPENVPVAARGLRSARAEQRTVPEACVETASLATSGLPTAARPRPKYVM